MIFVLGGILVVLILLLRALVAPIYLILTILLSYSATLGVVRLLFADILGAAASLGGCPCSCSSCWSPWAWTTTSS